MTYVELDRKFFEVKVDALGNERESDPDSLLKAARVTSNKRSWADLLNHRYVVVLGEAGAGKTKEFQGRAEALTRGGGFAFFAELRQVALKGLRATLSPRDQRQLKAWRLSESEAVFFLDSLDEAKLERHSLRDALCAVQQELDDDWMRVRLVVSCRPSDWMARADRDALAAVTLADPDIFIVELGALDEHGVELIARECGVPDPLAMIAAIKAGHATAFMERPRDVEWMSAYWSRHRRIGSFSEVIQQNVEAKLQEPSAKRQMLSLNDAKRGAAALAGVSLLSRRLALRTSEDELDARWAESAIDVSTVLPDWKKDAQSALLRLPLFDESTYGLMRIHHRSVHEYLAAKWLEELCALGLTVKQFDDMFRVENRGEKLVVGHMAPVAAWLSLWDAGIRDHVAKVAPGVLIEHGDPSTLAPEARVQILRAYCENFGDHNAWFDWPADAALERFSDAGLTTEIVRILGLPSLPEELARFLFRLASLGRLVDLAPSAVEWALDATKSDLSRAAAIAVVRLGTLDGRNRLLPLRETETWSPELASEFLLATFPDALGAAELLKVVAATGEHPGAWTSLHWALDELSTRGDLPIRLTLLDGAVEFGRTHPLSRATRVWLIPLIGALLGVLINDQLLPDTLQRVADGCEWLLGRSEDLLSTTERVRKAVADSPLVRRELFLRAHANRLGDNWRWPTHYPPLTDVDVSWLMDVDSTLATSAFEHIWRIVGPDDARPHRLAATREDLAARLAVQTSRALELRAREASNEARESAEREARKSHFVSAIGALRGGSTHELRSLLAEVLSQWNGRGVPRFELVEAHFGIDVVKAAIEGSRLVWRTDDRDPEQRWFSDLLSLTGLEYDVEAGLDVSSLVGNDFDLAVHLGFGDRRTSVPDWMRKVVATRGSDVVRALSRTLNGEYDAPVFCPGVLQRLRYGFGSIPVIADAVTDIVTARCGGNPEARRYAVEISLLRDASKRRESGRSL